MNSLNMCSDSIKVNYKDLNTTMSIMYGDIVSSV